MDFFAFLLDQLVAAGLSWGVAALLAVLIAVVTFISLLGKVMFWIGAGFGPLLIAAGVMPFTRGFTVNWMRFQVGAAMYQAVAGGVLVMMNAVFQQLAVQGQRAVQGELVATAAALGMLVMAGVAIMITLSVPSITASLFGGGGGAPTVSAQSLLPRGSSGGGGGGGSDNKK